MKRPALLVAALDADLREAIFSELSGRGFRVDAVADMRSARRRLECDEYGLVVIESPGPFSALEQDLSGVPWLAAAAAARSPEDLAGLVSEIEDRLGLAEADSAEVDGGAP